MVQAEAVTRHRWALQWVTLKLLMTNSDSHRLWKCFSPLLGIFSGSAIAWVLYFYSPHFDWTSLSPYDIASRSYTILFALYGWAVGITLGQGRRLHCGGTEERAQEDNAPLSALMLVLVALLVIGAITLSGQHYVSYTIVFMLATFALLGEVGWGDPFWIVTRLTKSN